MADAVGADQAFFSTCGSSLSVKAAMLAVAGGQGDLVSVHKMGTGFEQGSVFHRQGDLVDPYQLSACADMLMTTSPNVLVYAALDGWRRQMVDLDPLHGVIDVSALGINGYAAADWLREHERIDMGLSDHRRVEATLSPADDDKTAARLLSVVAQH